MSKEMKLGLLGAAIIAALAVFGMITYAEHVRDDADAKAKIAIEQAKVEAAAQRIIEIQKDADKRIGDLEKVKATIKTPAQAKDALRQYSPLPDVPILPDAPSATGAPQQSNLTLEDAKKLADFSISCKQCEISRASAEAQLAEKDKQIESVKKERDAALTQAKGGSFLKRIKRNSKWFVIGAVAGAAAISATHR